VTRALEIALDDGRVLTYDDVGDPDGAPVVYLHGTPDSRLARHPDDSVAAQAGIRLLAVDRPGYGGTSPLRPGAVPDAFADDLARLLDALEIDRTGVLAWSGGALEALGAVGAVGFGGRLKALMLVAGVVPCDAYDEPEVRAAATARLGLLELAETLPPRELAEAVAPLLAPYPCDLAAALEHQREQRRPADQAALAGVPGAVDRMAEALVEAVRGGLAGVEADIRAQVQPLGDVTLGRIAAAAVPVQLVYGSADTVTPSVFGDWYAHHLPQARLDVVDGAGHYLPFTYWPQILTGLAREHQR
jgi:pimeloyl-ACP methyl ester carboxylesterase